MKLNGPEPTGNFYSQSEYEDITPLQDCEHKPIEGKNTIHAYTHLAE